MKSAMQDLTLERDGLGRLLHIAGDGTPEPVVPVRAFPLTAPDHGISLVGSDGDELVWVDRLSALPADLRQLLQEELVQREFTPVIQRIESVSTFSTPSTWQVSTDRGPTSFVLRSEDDIRRVGVADFRRHIGLVLQEPFLFFGTIAENIAYGKPAATRAEIVAAARAAHAHEFILRLPQGYDSLVGERGQGLSGGERQRISIARALLIDPRILILDEATSSVDTETEKEIQKALDNLVQGRTTIAIAHRLSTLRKADRLVVMDRGQVVEIGPHDELMEQQGAYWRLYQAQARQVDDDGETSASAPSPTHAAHPAGDA